MSHRDRLVILVVAVVAALGAGWLLVVSPKRDEASKLAAQVQTEQGQLDAVRSQLAQGETARLAFARSYGELARLGEAVPADDNVPSLIYELQSAASASGVDFRTLAVTAGTGPATTAASTTGSRSSGSTLPPGASVGPAGFPAEQFNFTFQGNFFHLSSFFQRLERFVVANGNDLQISGRLITLNAINLVPAPSGFPQISATVSATTYMEPAAQGVLNGATPAGPAGTTAAPVSSTIPSSSSAAPPAATISSPVR